MKSSNRLTRTLVILATLTTTQAFADMHSHSTPRLPPQHDRSPQPTAALRSMPRPPQQREQAATQQPISFATRPHTTSRTQAVSGRARVAGGLSVARDGAVGVKIDGQPHEGTDAAKLVAAASAAGGSKAMSPARISAFVERALPVLAESAATTIFEMPEKSIELASVVKPAAENVAKLGGHVGNTPDTNYPPRAAKGLATAFGKAVGVSEADMNDALEFSSKLAGIQHEQGRYGPTLSQVKTTLGSEAHDVVLSATKVLSGSAKFDALSPKAKAFTSLMVLNNLTWHVTNFQRGGQSGQESRVDVTQRNGTYNTYRDNLSIQHSAHGVNGAAYMVLIDAYNQGKPGVDKVDFR